MGRRPLGIDLVERTMCCLEADTEQRETMNLRDHKVRRDQRDPLLDGRPKCAVGIRVMLVAPAAQRDECPAIDEQSCGDACGAAGAARQCRSR